jgi:hypothetical protein
MNDLEKLRSADPSEDGGIRDKYRNRVIRFVAEKHAEAIEMSPRDVHGYILAVEEEDLRQKSWAELVEELTFVVDDTDTFSVMDLEAG